MLIISNIDLYEEPILVFMLVIFLISGFVFLTICDRYSSPPTLSTHKFFERMPPALPSGRMDSSALPVLLMALQITSVSNWPLNPSVTLSDLATSIWIDAWSLVTILSCWQSISKAHASPHTRWCSSAYWGPACCLHHEHRQRKQFKFYLY